MKYFDQYHLPKTADEALDLLAQYDGHARIIAGGTDLLVDLQTDYIAGHRPHYQALVDLSRLEGAREIHADEDWVIIGCAATHSDIVQAPLVQRGGQALAEACSVVGGPQVRNVATLAGNVAHALPAADGTIALMALGGEAQVASLDKDSGRVSLEWVPLCRLFRGPGASAVDSTRELILALRFHPTGKHEASAFSRIMRPQGVALPILAMAARVRMEGETIVELALCAGPVAPVPFRANEAEAYLSGRKLTRETLEAATERLVRQARPRTSPHRASKEYRFELLPSLFEQALRCAVERAQTQAR